MKLCRYGDAGQERPGLIDDAGNIRDLSAHVGDLGRAEIGPDACQAMRAPSRSVRSRSTARPTSPNVRTPASTEAGGVS